MLKLLIGAFLILAVVLIGGFVWLAMAEPEFKRVSVEKTVSYADFKTGKKPE